MGMVFEQNDVTLWSPSRAVGSFLLVQVRAIQGFIHTDAGLVETMSDTITLDTPAINAFLRSLRRSKLLDNGSMVLMCRGAVTHLLALLISSNDLEPITEKDYLGEWIGEAKTLAKRRMAIQDRGTG